jgi:hypothetical protein
MRFGIVSMIAVTPSGHGQQPYGNVDLGTDFLAGPDRDGNSTFRKSISVKADK